MDSLRPKRSVKYPLNGVMTVDPIKKANYIKISMYIGSLNLVQSIPYTVNSDRELQKNHLPKKADLNSEFSCYMLIIWATS